MALSESIIKNAVPRVSDTLTRIKDIKLTRWKGGQHPTFETITRKMTEEGLRPYTWQNGPNFRMSARSNGYTKVLYCVDGSVELMLPDISQSIFLRPGDRVELPAGIRHATIIGPNGARCVESELTEAKSDSKSNVRREF
jgi:hypothetical protein